MEREKKLSEFKKIKISNLNKGKQKIRNVAHDLYQYLIYYAFRIISE